MAGVNERVQAAREQLGIPSTIDLGRWQNLLEFFEVCCAQYADYPAFSSLGHTMTYAELDRLSRDFAAYLQHLPDLKTGDRVAVQLPNLVQYPVVLFGVLRAGMVLVNTNPLYTDRELHHQLTDSGAKVLVVLANVADVATHVVAQTAVKHVIVTELADLHRPLKRWTINLAARYLKRMVPAYHFHLGVTLRDALAQGARHAYRRPRLPQEQLAVLQYTGGTTGLAKGAMLTHANLLANALQGEAMFTTYGLGRGCEVLIAPLPLYHIYAFTLSMIMMGSGNHSVLIPNPRDLSALVKEASRWRFSLFCGLNTLFVALCDHAGFRSLDFRSLKVTLSGGMALTRDAALRWEEVTGTPVYEGYGLTETSPVVSLNPGNGNRLGTIGLAVPATEVALMDDAGQAQPADGVGELWVRGPQVMKGYWQQPQESAAVLSEDGWLRTGDIARLDEAGYLRIVDRKKDMILVSGFNVYPNEVEDELCTHPNIIECAAIGVPDPHSGEVVKLFVVTREPMSTAAVIEYARTRLTGYKVPKLIEFRDQLPKSNVGKVLRKALREPAPQVPKG